MGIIRAALNSVGGGLADQWLEVIEADDMNNATLMSNGVKVRTNDKRNTNTKGTADVISNGSVIHVYDNQFMVLMDGGKVVDYTAEPGYFKVDNSSMPSLFDGKLGDSVKGAMKETLSRIRFGGTTPVAQKVLFINMQEIPGIPFGTPAPVSYYDQTLDADLDLRSHGYFSIKITDPLKFYAEVAPKNGERVEFRSDGNENSISSSIKEMLISEFLSEFQAALNKLSADNIRITRVQSEEPTIAKYMRQAMDEDWSKGRGIEIQSVGIKAVSLTPDSDKLLKERARAAMYKDPSLLNSYATTAMARGIENAGSNEGGA
ncbi:MAG: SPFH domain-containing protein, partial [Clostridiales bacterium]|nr:SPFH domain-containing protein [Clostridiales bacterium]